MADYNTEVINDVIGDFKICRMYSTDKVTIMFDADNTLFRFSTYGNDTVAIREMYSKYYFKNLPIFPEAPTVIENLQRLGFECGIVTTTIDSPFCAQEKSESFKYHFPMIHKDNIHILDQKTPKWTICDNIHNVILVDDYYRNIMDWYNAGGVAIKKSYSGKKRPVPVITSLIDLFYVLKQLRAY